MGVIKIPKRKKFKYSYARRKAIDMGRIAKKKRKKGSRISSGDRGIKYSKRF